MSKIAIGLVSILLRTALINFLNLSVVIVVYRLIHRKFVLEWCKCSNYMVFQKSLGMPNLSFFRHLVSQ